MNFPKKGRKTRRGYCKKCNSIRHEMMKEKNIDIPKLEQGVEIEVRGKMANGHGYTYFVPYEKAVQMVNEKVAYVVHERLIRKYFDRETFRKLIFKRFGKECFYCGEFADTIDHMIPRSYGGLSSFSNCVPACSKCNSAKDNLTLDEFLFYFDPISAVPNLSLEDYVRSDLIKLVDKLESYNTYLNICLKKIDNNEMAFDIPIEAEALEDKVNQINETIRRYMKVQNRESLV